MGPRGGGVGKILAANMSVGTQARIVPVGETVPAEAERALVTVITERASLPRYNDLYNKFHRKCVWLSVAGHLLPSDSVSHRPHIGQ